MSAVGVKFLEAVKPDSDFYENAPLVIEGRASFAVQVAELWSLLDEIDMPPWHTEWLTEPPKGDGSRRILRMGGRHLNTGYFTAFEPYREMWFYLGELAVPGIRRLAAVMWFEDLGPRSAIRWRVAIEPAVLAGRTTQIRSLRVVADPIMSLGMKLVFGYGLRYQRAKKRRLDGAPRVKAAETEVVLDASIEQVWDTVTNLGGWYQWTVLPFRARGNTPVAGTHMWVGMRKRGWIPVPLARWQIVDPGRELEWGGEVRVLGGVRHGMRFETLDDGRVRLRHAECVSGPLSTLIPNAVIPVWRFGLETVNWGLKRHLARR
ncbi:hypothetical protein JK358_34915 [Nocardia sp. 2]|uniref:SRPBCC family protein n=1 Tax=Nocardia acididurans TaxID=2802282 RepID=A0ABS1MH63_9NOCA|nr:hypothetical protein [Nocardia acididurans]MBL1079609.1 hypothetical protein [Nocardia acididurans]